jgi:hypothetical protein
VTDLEAEVLAAFYRYEDALRDGDVAVMTESFADSPELIRFGITDLQVGSAELAQWRLSQPPLPAGRHLFDTRVIVLGPAVALVTTMFDYPGESSIGRQSQLWQRSEKRWQVVHAHVSVVEKHLP